jgi:hypothetical protein
MGPVGVSADFVQIEGSESPRWFTHAKVEMEIRVTYVFAANSLDYIIRRCPEQFRDNRELVHVYVHRLLDVEEKNW